MSSHTDESPVWEQLVWPSGLSGESRWRGGIDTYSRTGLWMGLWPNLAQFLNWEKALTKAKCWLKANLLWTCHLLPGTLSALSLRHLPSQGKEMLGEEALLAPPPHFFCLFQLFTTLMIKRWGGESRPRTGKWKERRWGHPWRCTHKGSQEKPEGSHCQRRKEFEQTWGLRGKWRRGSEEPHKHKEKKEKGKNPRMESELGRDT